MAAAKHRKYTLSEAVEIIMTAGSDSEESATSDIESDACTSSGLFQLIYIYIINCV